MPEAIAGQIAGAAIGGLLGGDGGGSQQTASKEPWAPAQQWLKDLISQGQGLQGYYQSNPFNQLQQSAYSNIANDGEGYRQTILPSLLGFANTLTSGQNSYDRRNPFAKPMGFTFPTNITPQTTQQNSDTNYLNGLYQAKLNRAPDAEGLAYWQNALANGADRSAVAQDFNNARPRELGVNTNPAAPVGGLLADAAAFNALNPYQNGKLPKTPAPQQSLPGANSANGMMPNRLINGVYYDIFNGASW